MNATVQLRFKLSLQRVSRVKLWTAQLLQKRKKRIKSEHTMAAIKKGEVNSVLFLLKFSILYFNALLNILRTFSSADISEQKEIVLTSNNEQKTAPSQVRDYKVNSVCLICQECQDGRIALFPRC